ncbi:hypothetical protein BaRGS_00023688 [Batillaria attramentaria]|uniref:Uncharacterized protein n=1 Tax=Batillaria attramentaria TaxID=370345 RepID=A0ABD0KD55_9CAEN
MGSEPKPSQTYDEYWLYEANFLNFRFNDFPDSESGKWMTFPRPRPDLDAAWNRGQTSVQDRPTAGDQVHESGDGSSQPCLRRQTAGHEGDLFLLWSGV